MAPEPARAAWSQLIWFPNLTLSDTRDSRHRRDRINKLLGKLLGGEQLQPANLKVSGKRQRRQERELARRISAHQERGSIKRASRCLDQAELAEPNTSIMQKLAQLHPQSPPPKR